MNTVKKKKILVLPQSAPAFEAARAMSENFYGCAVVSDGKGHIVGIVTDRDLACGVLGERLAHETALQEIMAPNPKFVYQSDSPNKALNKMQKYGVRRIPVIQITNSGSEHCVGMYSLDDFIMSKDFSLADIKPVVRKQIRTYTSRSGYKNKNDQHKEQTLNRFNKNIASEIRLKRSIAEEISFLLLKNLVQVLPSKVATSFISEIPSLLQEDLRAIRQTKAVKPMVKKIQSAIESQYDLGKIEAAKAIKGFWSGLTVAMPSAILKHVFLHLPSDWQDAFNELANEPYVKLDSVTREVDINETISWETL